MKEVTRKEADFLGQAQEMVKTAIEAHKYNKNTELGESSPGRIVEKKRGAMGGRVTVNMHAMEESSVGAVRDARITAKEQSKEREQGSIV